MAIILRKAGAGPVKVLPISPPSADAVYNSPFRESYHDAAKPPSADPVKAKPKAVFKITPGKSLLRPGLPPPSPAAPSTGKPPDPALLALGLAGGVEEGAEPTSASLYPAVGPGEFVVITNNLFPWVKHYKPGDIARVLYSSVTHSHPEDPIKYRAYFLEVVDGPRKGQKPMLFRWEFEARKNSNPLPRIEGRVITQT